MALVDGNEERQFDRYVERRDASHKVKRYNESAAFAVRRSFCESKGGNKC